MLKKTNPNAVNRNAVNHQAADELPCCLFLNNIEMVMPTIMMVITADTIIVVGSNNIFTR